MKDSTKRKLKIGSSIALLYTMFSFLTLPLNRITDNHNNEIKKIQLPEIINTPATIIHDSFALPYRLSGIPTAEDHLSLRRQVFNQEGIDPTNPDDNEKRFELYRSLGYAVRDPTIIQNNIKIPFEAWNSYISNQTFTPSKLLTRKFPILSGKIIFVAIPSEINGRINFKADSESQGGNENGVMELEEWDTALQKMGYITPSSLAQQITNGVGMTANELESLLEETTNNPNYVQDIKTKSLTFEDQAPYLSN